MLMHAQWAEIHEEDHAATATAAEGWPLGRSPRADPGPDGGAHAVDAPRPPGSTALFIRGDSPW
jgi:hypothetical protein